MMELTILNFYLMKKKLMKINITTRCNILESLVKDLKEMVRLVQEEPTNRYSIALCQGKIDKCIEWLTDEETYKSVPVVTGDKDTDALLEDERIAQNEIDMNTL